MSLNISFAGKKVLITGGGQGIGKRLVERFHDGGAQVITIDKNAETIAQLKKELPNVQAEVVDLTDWDATRKVVESFGPIDHLVNNAAVILMEKFMEITKEKASLQFDVNVIGAINVSQVVAKGMIERGTGGSIVNICSFGGRVAAPASGTVLYCSTKAALENLTKSMALQLGEHKIKVNCILPGSVDTPLLHAVDTGVDPNLEKTNLRVINKRLIDPSEIADLAMYLLSSASDMVVGESVVIDGGILAN